MRLSATTYSAYRGYAWSNIPPEADAATLSHLYRIISDERGEFPDPLALEMGIVSDGRVAAAFTIQNVDRWDAAGRASNYGAFVLIPLESANAIDFVSLVNLDFFWTPTREPPAIVDYEGPGSLPASLSAAVQLQVHNHCLLDNPTQIGYLLETYGWRSKRWICRMQADHRMDVKCDPWNLEKEHSK